MLLNYDLGDKERSPLGFAYFVDIYNQFVIQSRMVAVDSRRYVIRLTEYQKSDNTFRNAVIEMAQDLFNAKYIPELISYNPNNDVDNESQPLLIFKDNSSSSEYKNDSLSPSPDDIESVYIKLIMIYIRMIIKFNSKSYYDEGVCESTCLFKCNISWSDSSIFIMNEAFENILKVDQYQYIEKVYELHIMKKVTNQY